MDRRRQLFGECAKTNACEVAQIYDYRRVSGQPLPAIVIIVDEFQNLLTESGITTDRQDRSRPANFLAAVAKGGAKFGLHLILSTQTYESVPISDGDRDANFGLRLACRLTRSDCIKLMGPDNDEASTIPRGSFQAILNEGGGKRDRNQRFTLAPWDGSSVPSRCRLLAKQYQHISPIFRAWIQTQHNNTTHPPTSKLRRDSIDDNFNGFPTT